MVDLAPILVIAAQLVKENGRSVTLIKHDATLADASQPWEGPADARAAPAATAVLDALFFNPAAIVAELGITFESTDLVPRAEQIMMVIPGAVNVEDFQEVLDDGTYWKIGHIEIFKPGTVVALAYIAVGR